MEEKRLAASAPGSSVRVRKEGEGGGTPRGEADGDNHSSLEKAPAGRGGKDPLGLPFRSLFRGRAVPPVYLASWPGSVAGS